MDINSAWSSLIFDISAALKPTLMRQVDSNHFVTISAQPVYYNAADEPGRTRHCDSHLTTASDKATSY
jgi:hypothetical protein